MVRDLGPKGDFEMATTIERRILSSISDETAAEFVSGRFLDRLWQVKGEAEAVYGRSINRAIALGALFVLLLQAGVTKIVVGGVELTHLGLLEKVIPVLVAYVFVDAAAARITAQAALAGSSTIIGKIAPAAQANELDYLATRPAPWFRREICRAAPPLRLVT